MIVLHALWDNRLQEKLHIWAESSNLLLSSATKRGGRQAEAQPSHQHPYALNHALLRDALNELASSMQLQSATSGTLTLLLPSTSKEPASSPELILEKELSDSKVVGLKPWDVATLSLDPGLALDFLLHLPNYPPHHVAFGDALRFWAEVAKFSLALLTRQSYMPTLEKTAQKGVLNFRAAWRTVLVGEDTERLSVLAKAIPPLCWSFLAADEMTSSATQNIVQSFLDATVDAFVRESLSATPLLPGKSGHGRQTKPRSLQEQWLQALVSHDTTLTATPAELQLFAEKLQNWLHQIQPAEANAAFRTCFRLDAPGEDHSNQTDWHISFYLQANDDRSLLVPAEQVWKERSSTLTFLKRSFENPQERILADLGKASRLFPTLEESLKTARPTGLNLDTEQAYSFLRESAPLLEQSGFGVLVPPWWSKPTAKLGVKLKVKPKAGAKDGSGLLGLRNIIDYDWTIAVGDSTLTFEEFESLVDLKVPLIKIRGQWVELRPEEIEAAIAFFKKKHGKGEMTLGDALRIGLGQGTSELGLPVMDIEGSGWLKEILDKLTEGVKITTIKQPASLHGQLRPYQLKGVSWLAFLEQYGFGACLADDMGLGKCLSASSLLTVNGRLQKAEDIWNQYAGEAVFDGQGHWADPHRQLLTNSIDESSGRIVQTSIKRLYRQQVSEIMRTVRLEDGNSVTITRPHKLLTDKGWTNDLHVGDYVCVPAQLIWEGKAEDSDLIKMLAWQIAEGHEHEVISAVAITQKDVSVLDDLQNCLQRFSEKYGIKINHPSIHVQRDTSYLRLNSVSYRRFLEARGYEWGKLSRDKSIPDFIMQADLASIRIFLRNFFEAEASVVASMNSIEISTASPVLIQQLSYLLRRFGIWLRISTKQKHATNGSGIFRPNQIGVLGGHAARKFCQEIGFAGKKKQQKLENICAFICNTNVEGIPASSIMAQLVSTTKLPIRHFGMNTVYVTGSQQFSSSSLTRVVVACESILSGEAEQEYRKKTPSKWSIKTLQSYAQLDKQLLTTTKLQLQQLIDQEVYYCRIKSIEEIQYDGWVYDFEVEDHHNFVANNILCHNTVQLITLLLHERSTQQNGTKPNPALLICPMSIVGNWQKELERFAPSLHVMVHHGHERLSGAAFEQEARQNDIVITTYALALRDQEHLATIDWEYMVVDEAQNIKNDEAKQTKAIKKLEARHRIALTGTPVENRLSELWSIMEFLNPGYLGSGTDFRKNFSIPIERYRDADRSESLKRLIQPFVLRRLKTDKSIIADLPDKMEMKVFCNLTQEQASLYEAVVKEMMAKIEEAEEGIQRKGLVLSTLLKLKQVCNHPAQFVADGSTLEGRSGKLARLEEMLEEVLAAGDKALIFTQFAEMGKLLRVYLQERLGCETLFLHGGTPKKQRDIMVQRFQEDRRGAQLFILSLKAGGVGLNLTAANHVFHFDRWWNPAVENQATDRAFRIGQKKNVQVHKFVCIGTLEERIDMMIEQKRELAESIVGAGENWLTEMSTTQLKELFALSREAVGE